MGRLAKRRRPAALLIVLAPALLALALLSGACGGGADTADTADAADTADTADATTTTDRQGERRPDARIFTWQSSDGVLIEAELRRGGEEWVLLGHQYTGSRRDWDQMVEGFVARGYTVLIWDFRCHGESGCNTLNDSKRDATKEIWREWVAALDYAIDNGARVIHAGGASMGGTSLIQVAADRDDVATIFAISSPNRFQGLDALENYDRVTVPKLFIVGADDTAAPDFAQRYFDRATGPARLNVLATDLHGNTLAKDPVWGPIVQSMLYAFVQNSEGYVAAGEVNNLTGGSAADSEDEEEAAAPAGSTDAEPDDEQSTTEVAEAAPEQADGQAAAAQAQPLGRTGPPPSGYLLALLAPGRGGEQLIVVDPFAQDDFLITRQFEGDVMGLVWAPTGASIVVGQADQLVFIDLGGDPPPEVVILTASFLPPGLAPDFLEMDLSSDGFVLSFAVLPDDVAQAPSTPALVNLLGPTLLAPYAGALSDSPSLAGLFSPDGRLLLSREVGGLVVLQPGTLEVAERLPAPVLPETSDACLGGSCVQISYDTVFPDQYDWLASAATGVIWVRYSNALFLRLPGDTALTEWLTLPGRAIDVAISPSGRVLAWISIGPPDGTNTLFLSDLDSGGSALLVQDENLLFFDMEWSPDSRYIAFTSVTRGDSPSAGVFIVDTETGEVMPVGPGCCAQWSPILFPPE